jgi:hypothetical protein
MGWEFISEAATQEREGIYPPCTLCLFAFQSRVRWGVCALSVIVGSLRSASNLGRLTSAREFRVGNLERIKNGSFLAFVVLSVLESNKLFEVKILKSCVIERGQVS